MREFEYYQLDVFTDKKFSGNPLAVFPDAEGILDEEMQKIANELNLSETVFVLPSEKALRNLRIFTPKQELPLAGHPVVGTWNLLANLGVTPKVKNGNVTVEQEVQIGILPVDIEFLDGEVVQVEMTQGEFQASEIISNEAEISKLAKALGLERSDLKTSKSLPIQTVSTSIKALDVPIASLDALSKCRINSSLLSEIYLQYDAIGVFAFCFEAIEESSEIHARFFAPADGIPEDPATGSAAGSLAGYLTYYGAIDKNRFTIEQGDFMKRPSRIYASVHGEKGRVEKVQIGGKSVIVAKGKMFLS